VPRPRSGFVARTRVLIPSSRQKENARAMAGVLRSGGEAGIDTSGVALRCFLSAFGKPVTHPRCGFVARTRVLIPSSRHGKGERPHEAGVQNLAERQGFEPWVLCSTVVFETTRGGFSECI